MPRSSAETACVQVGTPLTHKRFLRRHQGSYGPGIRAGEGTFPGPNTPIPGARTLYACSMARTVSRWYFQLC